MAETICLIMLFFSLSFVIILSVSESSTVDGMSINQTSETGNMSAANQLSDLVGKGLELYNMSNYQESLIWFDKALAVDPNNSSAIINKARAYYNLDKFQEALQWFDKA